jgi:PPM family protein phosphatase
VFGYNSGMLRGTLKLECFGMSDIGRVREHNEDVWAAYPEKGLFLLADGMGGHAAGEVAAKEAVNYLYQLFQRWEGEGSAEAEHALPFFKKAFGDVNEHIYKLSQQENSLKGMGTTLCVLFFCNTQAIVAHVGDSRIYRMHAQARARISHTFSDSSHTLHLEPLTEDHSLLAELKALSAVDSAEADSFPYKHILTRAIGTHPQVEPTLSTVSVNRGDRFLLCSDGLTNYITPERIAQQLRASSSLSDQAQSLVAEANDNGGGDNITVVLVEVCDDLP